VSLAVGSSGFKGGEEEVSGEGIPGSGAGPDWRAVGSGSMGYHFMVDLYTDRVKI